MSIILKSNKIDRDKSVEPKTPDNLKKTFNVAKAVDFYNDSSIEKNDSQNSKEPVKVNSTNNQQMPPPPPPVELNHSELNTRLSKIEKSLSMILKSPSNPHHETTVSETQEELYASLEQSLQVFIGKQLESLKSGLEKEQKEDSITQEENEPDLKLKNTTSYKISNIFFISVLFILFQVLVQYAPVFYNQYNSERSVEDKAAGKSVIDRPPNAYIDLTKNKKYVMLDPDMLIYFQHQIDELKKQLKKERLEKNGQP